MDCKASISSFSRMTPISAAKALPERPATMIDVEQHAHLTQRRDRDQIDGEDLRTERFATAASRDRPR